jgi:excisionase family DNA binding protein
MLKELLTTREAAEYLAMHIGTVQAWARDGRIPTVRVGGRWKFRKADLDEWIDGRRVERQPALPGT